MTAFRFSLTDEEKAYLKDLVRRSIAARLRPGGEPLPEPPTDTLRQPYGAFVTLKKDDCLRGCIGHIIGDKPLFQTIAEMAQAAAFQDPRFPPVTAAEEAALAVEISILSPLEPCPDPELIEPGRHGLLVALGSRSGLLLPQVATEWGWDRPTFLAQTCAKAGLPASAWRDPQCEIYWFQAEVF